MSQELTFGSPERVAQLLRLRAAREAYLLNSHIAVLLLDAATLIEDGIRNGGVAR